MASKLACMFGNFQKKENHHNRRKTKKGEAVANNMGLAVLKGISNKSLFAKVQETKIEEKAPEKEESHRSKSSIASPLRNTLIKNYGVAGKDDDEEEHDHKLKHIEHNHCLDEHSSGGEGEEEDCEGDHCTSMSSSCQSDEEFEMVLAQKGRHDVFGIKFATIKDTEWAAKYEAVSIEECFFMKIKK